MVTKKPQAAVPVEGQYHFPKADALFFPGPLRKGF